MKGEHYHYLVSFFDLYTQKIGRYEMQFNEQINSRSQIENIEKTRLLNALIMSLISLKCDCENKHE